MKKTRRKDHVHAMSMLFQLRCEAFRGDFGLTRLSQRAFPPALRGTEDAYTAARRVRARFRLRCPFNTMDIQV